jgi:hypothetical protein
MFDYLTKNFILYIRRMRLTTKKARKIAPFSAYLNRNQKYSKSSYSILDKGWIGKKNHLTLLFLY